jgi:hypothetical protein
MKICSRCRLEIPQEDVEDSMRCLRIVRNGEIIWKLHCNGCHEAYLKEKVGLEEVTGSQRVGLLARAVAMKKESDAHRKRQSDRNFSSKNTMRGPRTGPFSAAGMRAMASAVRRSVNQ